MPPLKIKIKRDGLAVIICVSGELDVASAPILTERAGRVLRDPAERLELDLSGLTFIDCAGARALGVLKKSVPPGCPVLVRGASRRVRKVVAIVEAPVESGVVPGPDGGRGPVIVPEPEPEPVSVRGQERTGWLGLEAQVLASWAEQARTDSRNVLARARAARAGSASQRSLADHIG
jgi:anti-anti-sigma factor